MIGGAFTAAPVWKRHSMSPVAVFTADKNPSASPKKVRPLRDEAEPLPEPYMVNGVAQAPMQGVSMLYSFEDAAAAERRETQYFENVRESRDIP
jgi:hypothetical protein